jgi:hypothetical protein
MNRIGKILSYGLVGVVIFSTGVGVGMFSGLSGSFKSGDGTQKEKTLRKKLPRYLIGEPIINISPIDNYRRIDENTFAGDYANHKYVVVVNEEPYPSIQVRQITRGDKYAKVD